VTPYVGFEGVTPNWGKLPQLGSEKANRKERMVEHVKTCRLFV